MERYEERRHQKEDDSIPEETIEKTLDDRSSKIELSKSVSDEQKNGNGIPATTSSNIDKSKRLYRQPFITS